MSMHLTTEVAQLTIIKKKLFLPTGSEARNIKPILQVFERFLLPLRVDHSRHAGLECAIKGATQLEKQPCHLPYRPNV